MDLLTVLLHEAAHSLGLDHTNDAHALMAPTLQPGVRRLPSPELLAELQQRSNDDLLADGRVGTSFVPTRNPEPNAPLPLGLGFTAFWAGRMRKSGFGYAFESNERPAYDVAPNPTLLNTEFADGSRTYVVDLSGITPGTVASLSFDLIGFGHNNAASNSRVTVRDLKLGIPQTFDDAVTSAEDTPAAIAALANDLDADQPGFAPVIVTAATHGQVTINSDGTFGYTPEQNWSGVDSFSYKISDGRVDSNLATVTVTVTPVNDAPVAADVSFATLEEQGLVIDLRNFVTDVDNDVSTFTGQIITGPANGVLTLNTDGSYTYTPNADFNGVDSFTYTLNDGALDSNPATVTITVASVNDAPAGQSSTVSTLEDMPYVFQMSDFGFSDAHGYLRSVSPVRRSRMAVGRGSLPNRPGTMASNRSPK
jgi:VCBS repeat-containing protein